MKWLFFILTSFILFSCSQTQGKSEICDPACSTWKTCNAGTCELKAEKCDKNSDCKDNTKPICDENHECVAEGSDECDPICDNTWQSCINKVCITNEGSCKEDTDCKDGAKPICESHVCVVADEACGEADSCPEDKHCEEIDGFGKKCRHNKPENTYTRCTDGYDNDQNGHFDCDDWECQKLKVCEPKCADVECTGGKVCEPTTGDCIAVEIKTIKQVRDSHITGNIYKTKGIVVAGDKDGLYIQDSSERGIYVFINPGAGEFIGQVMGDEIEVSGTFKDYYGFAELIEPNVSVLSQNNTLPDFKVVDANDLENLDIYESMLVKFKNPNFTVTIAHQSGGPNTFLEDANSKEFYMRNDIYNYDVVDGDILTQVQGVLKYAKEKFRVLPRVEEDLLFLEFTCTPICDAGSEICVRDHDEVGKCELACTTACESYETCVINGTDAECQLTDGMCYIDDNGTERLTDDEVIGCEAHYNCVNNECVEATNSVPNGDLEDWDDDNTATDWSYEYGLKADTKVYKETNPNFVCEGSTSAKVRKTKADNRIDGKKNEFYSPAFPIDATTNKRYNISVQIIDNDPNVDAKVFWKFYGETGHNVESGAGVSQHSFGRVSIDFDGCKTEEKSNNWSIFAGLDEDEKAAVRTIKIGVRLSDQDGHTQEGFVYVDDFRIEEITE